MREDFRSFDELLNTIAVRPNNEIMEYEDSSQKKDDASWYGTSCYKEATDILREGYLDALKKIKSGVESGKKVESKLLGDIETPMPKNAIVGYIPNVPNALQNLPNSMITVDRKPMKKKTVSILYSMHGSCGQKRVIAAGNTKGTGADINYTGRYSLDRASLDRFAMVDIDYSEQIENAVSHNNEKLVSFVHAFRTAVEQSGSECLCSYRTIDRITKMQQAEVMSLPDIMESSLLKGVDTDILSVINSRLKENEAMSNNEYAKALVKARNARKEV